MPNPRIFQLRSPEVVSFSTLASSNKRLIEAHRLVVKHVLQSLEGNRHDDPKEH